MRRILSVAALALVAASTVASAQARRTSTATYDNNPSPEIGMDAGLTFGTGSPSYTQFDIPARLVRAGFFVSPQISIEPALGLHSVSGGGATFTDYDIALGLLYHFSTSRATNQVYVRPFLDLVGASGGGTSDSNLGFGAGVGVKVPLRSQIASRFEANLEHINNRNAIGLLAGLSFYTR